MVKDELASQDNFNNTLVDKDFDDPPNKPSDNDTETISETKQIVMKNGGFASKIKKNVVQQNDNL